MSREGSIEVIVKLAPDAEPSALRERAKELGVPLEPLHGSTSDPELASYAVGRVDPEAADDVIGRLLRVEGVEAAYAKAPGEPPERRAPDVQQP